MRWRIWTPLPIPIILSIIVNGFLTTWTLSGDFILKELNQILTVFTFYIEDCIRPIFNQSWTKEFKSKITFWSSNRQWTWSRIFKSQLSTHAGIYNFIYFTPWKAPRSVAKFLSNFVCNTVFDINRQGVFCILKYFWFVKLFLYSSVKLCFGVFRKSQKTVFT